MAATPSKVHATGSLQMRLIAPMMLVLATLFLMNGIMFYRVNRSIDSLNQVYSTSVKITQFGNALGDLDESFTDYINTKSDGAYETYRSMRERFESLIPENPPLQSNEALLLETNICNLSWSYLDLLDETAAIRAAGQDQYRETFAEAGKVHEYLNLYVRSLDTLRFQTNSENYDVIYTSLRNLEQFTMVLLILMSAVLLVLASIFLRSITRPLHDLARKAREVERGNLEIEIAEPEYDDEVGVLAGAFAEMLRAIRQNIEEIRERARQEMEMRERELVTETLLRDAELRFYQAQISPHFLFNTLNAGQQLAMMEGAERTYTFMENTASFFRGQLRGNGNSSTIREEIALVDHYMYIMNVRFSDEFKIHKEINERLLATRFPGMVLQPIVENSIHYAFPDWPLDEDKRILIAVYQEGENVVVEITDNGVGITEDKIHSILTDPVSPTSVGDRTRPDGNGVGLRNVRERLRLFYNREGVFTIGVAEDGGTRVRITVPREQGNAEQASTARDDAHTGSVE